MTVKLLVDRPIDGKEYKAGNLCDTDDNTEAGLISSKLAIADLAGGTAYVAPPVQRQVLPVTATTNLTGGIEISAGGVRAGGANYEIAVERFRNPGDSDSVTINKALGAINTAALVGAKLVFESGRIYTIDGQASLGYINDLDIDLNGALLFRAPASDVSTTLSAQAISTDSTITLESIPGNWLVGDTVVVLLGSTDQEASQVRRITEINHLTKTVTLHAAILATIGGTETFPIGSAVIKSFSFFAGRPSLAESLATLTPGANKRVRIHGGTFDGNQANQVTNSWRVNNTILLHSEGGQIYDNTFQNMSSENIVGHGVTVYGNVFVDLQGSAMHLSVNDYLSAVATPTIFTANTVRRTNLAGDTANGHAEGAITFSWGPGNTIITNNLFDGGGESVVGAFGTSGGANGSRLLVISGNVCKGYRSVFFSAHSVTYGVVVEGNAFHDCGDNTSLSTTLLPPANQIRGNAISGNTVLPQTFADSVGVIVPTIYGTVTAGVGTYVFQNGSYEIIGGFCHFSLSVKTTAHTGTGNTQIAGLPLPARIGTAYNPVNIWQGAGPVPGAGKLRQAVIITNQASIVLREWDTSTGVVANTNPIQAANEFYITGSYPV